MHVHFFNYEKLLKQKANPHKSKNAVRFNECTTFQLGFGCINTLQMSPCKHTNILTIKSTAEEMQPVAAGS